MKAILMSIQPKWCAKIASGEKTIEVRKTRPKIETPFKCYIYCTKGKEVLVTNKVVSWTGEVIGEFVCDKIYGVAITGVFENGEQLPIDIFKHSCLTVNEFHNYVGIKNRYGWHISELKIYDKPKELREFRKPSKEYHEIFEKEGRLIFADGWMNEPITRAPQSYMYVEELED